MRLVERHIVKDNRFEDICFKSGLLYNYVLYNIRQGIFSGNYLKEFDLSNKLCKENQFDFRNLPNHVSQQVIKQVFKNIKSWIKLKKDFEKNPSKYGNHRPHLPSYKQGKKQNMVVFTNCNCRVKGDNCIYFVKDIIKPIKTNVKKDELKQVRIIPQATCYVVEVVYERKETDLGLNKEWKNEINIGKRNNQHFVSIPHSKLIDKIVYKANLLGIEVITHEESYTSKIDHLAFEPLKKQESYLGKRKKRGLFQSSVGKLINADINGAIGIARKVVGDSFIGKIIDSGFVFNPVRINIL